MKKLLAIAALALACTAQAQEVKGIQLGQSEEEVKSRFHPNELRFMTIAGVDSMYRGVSPVKFKDGKVKAIIFFFRPGMYEVMRDAFISKYPEMRCKKETVRNRMNAEFENETCIHKNLRIERYSTDLDTSILTLVDREEAMREMNQQRSKAKDDI